MDIKTKKSIIDGITQNMETMDIIAAADYMENNIFSGVEFIPDNISISYENNIYSGNLNYKIVLSGKIAAFNNPVLHIHFNCVSGEFARISIME